jgi:hypothetical protein
VRKRAGPAHHLVGLLRINTKPEGNRHGLIEFRCWKFLQCRNGVREQISFGAIYQLGGGAITFTSISSHGSLQF